MKIKFWLSAAILSLCSLTALTARSAYTANATGQVTLVSTYAGGLVLFSISAMPTVACASNLFFAFSPNSVADKESRDHFLATLMLAKATGQTVTVGYDGNGAFCDAGYIGTYRISTP